MRLLETCYFYLCDDDIIKAKNTGIKMKATDATYPFV